MHYEKLTSYEASLTVGYEAISLAAVMTIMIIAIMTVIVYKIFTSRSGSTTIPGGFKFEWK